MVTITIHCQKNKKRDTACRWVRHHTRIANKQNPSSKPKPCFTLSDVLWCLFPHLSYHIHWLVGQLVLLILVGVQCSQFLISYRLQPKLDVPSSLTRPPKETDRVHDASVLYVEPTSLLFIVCILLRLKLKDITTMW